MAEPIEASCGWAVLFAALLVFGSRACWRVGGHLSIKGAAWDVIAASLLVAALIVLVRALW